MSVNICASQRGLQKGLLSKQLKHPRHGILDSFSLNFERPRGLDSRGDEVLWKGAASQKVQTQMKMKMQKEMFERYPILGKVYLFVWQTAARRGWC